MRSLPLLVLVAVVTGCSGSAAAIDLTSAGPDGSAPTNDAAPIDPPASDAGADASSDFIYGGCTPASSAPLTAGSHADAKGGYTVSWPYPWTGASSSNVFTISEPYSYVPTGASAPTNATANLFVYPTEQRTSEADASKRLADVELEYPKAVVHDLVVGGHPALIRWVQQPPPQPGCQGCAGDPGPDIVTITLAIAAGDRFIRMDGSARVNAPSGVFCDMQAIELGTTFP